MTGKEQSATEESAATLDRTVLVAINARERELFFGGEPLALPGVRFVEAETYSAEEWQAMLEAVGPEAILSCWSTPELPLSILSAERPLRYLCHLSGTVRKIVPRVLLEEGLLVTNWGSAAACDVAEHALLFVLAGLRSLSQWRETMFTPLDRQQHRIDQLATRSLRRQRVGIHGFGAIAREILRLLEPFGIRCHAYSAGVPEDFIRQNGAIPCASLEDLFGESDVLIECEALTPATQGTVTRELLARLPDDAVFVNVGRGAVVDEAALADEASSGRLRVGCDVFAGEPLPPDSPFWRAPRGVYSPHIAGPTQEANRSIGKIALSNLAQFFSGQEPENIVTLAAYDRST